MVNEATEGNGFVPFFIFVIDPDGLNRAGDPVVRDAQVMVNETIKVLEGMVQGLLAGETGYFLVEIKINPVVVDPEDVEMLEDLVITAANEASSKAKAQQEERMQEITGAMGDIPLPPGLI